MENIGKIKVLVDKLENSVLAAGAYGEDRIEDIHNQVVEIKKHLSGVGERFDIDEAKVIKIENKSYLPVRIFMLQTDKPSLVCANSVKLGICTEPTKQIPAAGQDNFINHFVYAVTNETVVAGDPIYQMHGEFIGICTKVEGSYIHHRTFDGVEGNNYSYYYKKIVATDDTDLIDMKKLPDFTNEFLNELVESNGKNFSHMLIKVGCYMPQSNGLISDGKITHEISLNPKDNTIVIPMVLDDHVTIIDYPSFVDDKKYSLSQMNDCATHFFYRGVKRGQGNQDIKFNFDKYVDIISKF